MKKYLKISLLIILYLILCNRIYTINKTTKKITSTSTITKHEKYPQKVVDKPIGLLKIPKINLNQKLYEQSSLQNKVDKNITILKESINPQTENSIFYLAAHSGTGKVAYFERLDELTENDEINLIYEDKTYIYQVKNSWEEPKNGYINISKEKQNQLILTTCSPTHNKKQLIINSILKESN